MRHGNISVFVPHIGCPHRCSFCNQNAITGKVTAPTKDDVVLAVKEAASKDGYNPKNTELAFFGGSFTAIPTDYMTDLLDVGYSFVKSGDISGIRISTRPDAIDENILSILKSKGVTAIELGCQSLDSEVLELNHRGHTVKDIENSSKLIKDFGFSLGLQMMTGLLGDTPQKSLATAEKIISLKADTVRIYPTILLKGTRLYSLYEKGLYTPQNLEDAVELTAQLLILFEKANVKVIRVGLHSIEENTFVAGPWHPAFGELCKSRVLLKKVLEILNSEKIKSKEILISVPIKMGSAMIGQKKCNVDFLKKIGYNCKIIEKNISNISVEELKAN